MMAIYVGNCLTIESDEGIKEVIDGLKRHDIGIIKSMGLPVPRE
jgi:hypothetical protein